MGIVIETDWVLPITVDIALRAQGADPEVTRRRRPMIVERAGEALELARPLLQPVVVYDEFAIVGREDEALELENGMFSCGAFVAERLSEAERLVAGVCTIGEGIEREVARLFPEDAVTALALDGVGSAALENLAGQACRRFQKRARRQGLRGLVHCWPGAAGWPIETAQPQIFGLLDPDGDAAGAVRLLPSMVMRPLKSLTLLLGLTPMPVAVEHECDVCAVGASCRYRAARSR